MVLTKQVADLITLARAFLAPWFLWLGLNQGSSGLPTAVVLLIANWTGDSIDGPLARRSRVRYQTWIGEHDLEIDMLVSVGLLGYLAAAGFLDWPVAILYLLLWAAIFWRQGILRPLGMLLQAPVYGIFIYVAVRFAPQAGRWLLVWMAVALVVTWPKFPKEIVPGFIDSMQKLLRRR